MPRRSRYATAAPSPTASAMGGVPASNFQGSSLVVNPSRRTSRIMPPPPRNGGISSSRSRRAHSTPMPVGPSILWALKARKSQPSAPTSVGRWGTDWAPSASTRAPARWAASAMRAKGVMVPSTFDMVVQATSFTPSRRRSRSEQVQAVVVVHAEPAQLDAAFLGQHEPGDDVGVVLHVGEEHGVARAEGSPGPRWRPRG